MQRCTGITLRAFSRGANPHSFKLKLQRESEKLEKHKEVEKEAKERGKHQYDKHVRCVRHSHATRWVLQAMKELQEEEAERKK
jgi:hypothetical protein